MEAEHLYTQVLQCMLFNVSSKRIMLPKVNVDVESQMKVIAMAAEPPCLYIQQQWRSTARRRGA